ncbi:unnamed protein product [Cladocopium goreaui]|uniref:PNPLA domain-containing protein n=1 Tax=Cladocopium goreaui TaxID=2562237 RepID=A0A9P1GBR9_9DINO|nr:unnamed protein product [Cladocopium goreaui]
MESHWSGDDIHLGDAWAQELRQETDRYEEDLLNNEQDRFLEWEKDVLPAEQALIEQKFRARSAVGWKGEGRKRFSVALSGGGIRAAAFQSGVLWQLADAGMIQDIEYLAAVSGGGYLLSAFASHVLTQESPHSETEVHGWYRAIIAKTIVRMQRNVGNFVRDFWRLPGVPSDGAGYFPRVCDLPFLLLIFFATISTGPILFTTSVLLPATELIEVYFGYAMRAAFCAPETLGLQWALLNHSRYATPALIVFALLLSISSTSWFVQRIAGVPSCKPGEEPNQKDVRYTVHMISHSLCGVCNRFAAALAILCALVWFATFAEVLTYDLKGWSALRYGICARYTCRNGTIPGNAAPLNPCDFLEHDIPWYMQNRFQESFDCRKDGTFMLHLPQLKSHLIEGDLYVTRMMDNGRQPRWLDIKVIIFIIIAVLAASILLLPFIPSLFPAVVLTCGPLLVLVFISAFVQFRVFGPLTQQPILNFVHYQKETWDLTVIILCGLSCITLPFLREIKSLWHHYYVRCLQQNFFAHGQDRNMLELKLDPWCPFVLVTGTVNDYARPNEDNSISEIAFTPLHVGSSKVGYVPSPPSRSLAQITALTGAGCLDAISLSMQEHVRVRFWLEVLNLAWGDFILFEPSRTPLMKRCLSYVPTSMRRGCTWWMHRSVTMVLLFVNTVLFCCGLGLYRFQESKEDCRLGRSLVDCSVLLMLAAIIMSFFSYFKYFHGFAFSPVLRQIQQATRFVTKSWRPPNMLYVTDGGVQDCTAILQLLQRKRKNILLVLAASDPTDDLAVLRTTMQTTRHQRIASFYDLKDSRRDVNALLDDFKNSDVHFFKMGIRYGWNEDEPHSLGILWIVKNRLPQSFANQMVRPHLDEEEIVFGQPKDYQTSESDDSEDPTADEELRRMQQEQLGGFGCCDCCHRWGNCGRKFPHLSFTGYMWLTPQLFSSLCRLGHDLSHSAVMDIKQSLS